MPAFFGDRGAVNPPGEAFGHLSECDAVEPGHNQRVDRIEQSIRFFAQLLQRIEPLVVALPRAHFLLDKKEKALNIPGLRL